MGCGEMRDFIEMDLVPERIRDLGEFYHVPIIFSEVSFQDENKQLVMSIGVFRIF